MKYFILAALGLFVLATAGILVDYHPGRPATYISYVSCVPALVAVVGLVGAGLANRNRL